MHIKFLNHGTGSGQRAAEYLLQDRDHTGKVRAEIAVLRGNPERVGQVIDSLDFTHRYTSGVVAWAPEDAPSDEQISSVIDDFERIAFAGLAPDQYEWTVVEHRDDDGGVHIHIIIARVELRSGLSMNVAPPGWQRTYDPLRDYYNHEMGWSRPDDPARARAVQPGHQALISASAVRQGLTVEPDDKALLTAYLLKNIDAGLIQNRDDIRAFLSEIGEITREGRDYISVKPVGHKRALRLKGIIYGADFITESFVAAGGAAEERRRAVNSVDRAAAKTARRKYESSIKKRAEFNQTRYEQAKGLDDGSSARSEKIADRPAEADAESHVAAYIASTTHGADSRSSGGVSCERGTGEIFDSARVELSTGEWSHSDKKNGVIYENGAREGADPANRERRGTRTKADKAVNRFAQTAHAVVNACQQLREAADGVSQTIESMIGKLRRFGGLTALRTAKKAKRSFAKNEQLWERGYTTKQRAQQRQIESQARGMQRL